MDKNVKKVERPKGLAPKCRSWTAEEFAREWDDAIFVFDTSVLLHFYCFSTRSWAEWRKVLYKLEERLWLPHQVSREYDNRRDDAIAKQATAYAEVIGLLTTNVHELIKALNTYRTFERLDTARIIRRIKAVIDSVKRRLEAKKERHPDYQKSDPIERTLQRIFLDHHKIGDSFNAKRTEEVLQLAHVRWQMKRPPGYADGSRSGDTFIWYQILEKAQAEGKPIAFITDDTKGDWWLQKDHPRRPRPELEEEIQSWAGVPFFMYTASDFLRTAQQYLQLPDVEGAIAQAIEEAELVREDERAAAGLFHYSHDDIRQAIAQAQAEASDQLRLTVPDDLIRTLLDRTNDQGYLSAMDTALAGLVERATTSLDWEGLYNTNERMIELVNSELYKATEGLARANALDFARSGLADAVTAAAEAYASPMVGSASDMIKEYTSTLDRVGQWMRQDTLTDLGKGVLAIASQQDRVASMIDQFSRGPAFARLEAIAEQTRVRVIRGAASQGRKRVVSTEPSGASDGSKSETDE